MTLHQRIAEALGWPLQDVRGFSLATLRDLVQDPGLKADISKVLAEGSHILGALA